MAHRCRCGHSPEHHRPAHAEFASWCDSCSCGHFFNPATGDWGTSARDDAHAGNKAERSEADNPQSVAAQPEGAERFEDCLCHLGSRCPVHGESGPMNDRELADYWRKQALEAEALLHKERARAEAAEAEQEHWHRLADERAAWAARERGRAERADTAEQRIESLERAIRQHREGICSGPQPGIRGTDAEDRALYAALDTTQAEQRQAAFPHEERMQAVDEAIEEVREGG